MLGGERRHVGRHRERQREMDGERKGEERRGDGAMDGRACARMRMYKPMLHTARARLPSRARLCARGATSGMPPATLHGIRR
jgi:hypothetical protein